MIIAFSLLARLDTIYNNFKLILREIIRFILRPGLRLSSLARVFPFSVAGDFIPEPSAWRPAS